jgi:alpha-N-arabinofuranosidase
MVRRWSTFIKQDGTRLIAGGATGTDYHWTDVLMDGSRKQFDDISLHYYTLPTGDWGKKGSAIGFDEAAWTATFKRTRALETMIAGHDAAMSKYDPEKKQGLIVAEWGTWYDPTPGSNPGFLVQENTLRDALIAATNFNIFHRHADRVHGANIAQMVNVLQAMIHTDGSKMVLTPTYWAFFLYQPFQGAQALPVGVTTPDYAEGLPAVDVTAARGADGKIHIAITNVDPDDAATISLAGLQPDAIAGQVLTAKTMDARNSYDSPNVVAPASFGGARFQGGQLVVKLPAKSLVVLTIG